MSKQQSHNPAARPAQADRGLEAMRDVLRGNLAQSLRGMEQESRLAAAWTVACGRALAGRSAVAGYQNAVVRVDVDDAVWMSQMISIRGVLARQMAQSSGLPVDSIEFALKRRQSR